MALQILLEIGHCAINITEILSDRVNNPQSGTQERGATL